MDQIEKVLRGDVAGNGCPIHPALVNMPLALYPLSAALRFIGTQSGWIRGLRGLDAVSLFSGAHYLNLAALLVSVPTAITGYIEYRTISPDNKAALDTVHKHIALNAAVSVIGVYNWLSLRSVPGFEPGAGNIIAGAIGALLLWYSGHMGAKLTYEHGIGVRRQGTARFHNAKQS